VKEFHPNEQLTTDVALTGSSDTIVARRSSIKLSDGPKIMVCIPIGAKPVTTVLECPQCKERGEPNTKMEVDEGFRPQGMVPYQFMIQQMNWLPPLNVTMAYAFKTGMRSAPARQIMTMDALQHPTVKYIFYVDDDMMIPPMGLYQLYNLMERRPDWGAVSGVYTTRQDPPEPLVYTDHGEGASWDFEMGPGAEPTKIMGAGAGVLLARVEAIRSWMAANEGIPIWADTSEFPAANGGRVTWGHDVRFIRNLTEAGWPCYVDGTLICGHYDMKTGKVFSVPADAPGFRKRAKNSQSYWDDVYTREGADTWRKYPEMFKLVLRAIKGSSPFGDNDGVSVSDLFHRRLICELGCGPGVLGSQIVGKFPVLYTGMDLSGVAVAQCHARGLDAEVVDLKKLGEGQSGHTLNQATDVVATELLEHLDDDALTCVMDQIAKRKNIKRLVVTVPDECMPPEEVPEHERMFTVESMRQLLLRYGWTDINIQPKKNVDGAHMVVLATRE